MQLFACNACGLVWLDPLPDGAEIKALYDNAYAGATTGYFKKVPSKLARARGRMRYVVRRLSGGADGKTFLDVGANGGFMSKAAQEAGFTVFGVEPDPISVVYAREHYPGITFLQGLLEDSDLKSQSFDVIYCSEVIEHVADSNRFVAKLASVMKPGGLLYITTPDIGHWRRPKDITTWDAFCPPSHCVYFSPNNLKLLLERHGFQISHKRFAWKPGIKIIARRMIDQARPLN